VGGGLRRQAPVIVFDQQGHGRTADTPRAMSYEQFGDDAAGLLRALEVERADVMGYSQGGGAALQLALRHPQLVGKLVTLSATYRQDGWYPAVLQALEGLSPDLFVDHAGRGRLPAAHAPIPRRSRPGSRRCGS
jgi:pimeloyl-ACP methyl ester carboxylesterase